MGGVPTSADAPSSPPQPRRAPGPRWHSAPERLANAAWRALPDFLIIGTMKGGTTTLYDLLRTHPHVLGAYRKEVHFFDLPARYARGESFYRSFFPTRLEMERSALAAGGPMLTGEASPFYLYHPHAPRRAFELLPHARLIALLRDPIDRAYSHYQHAVRHGWESRSFETAITDELANLGASHQRLTADPSLDLPDHQRTEYVHRGQYAEQLERWARFYPRDQMLVLRSESFFADPASTLRRVESFLHIPRHDPIRLAPSNVGGYTSAMPGAVVGRLRTHFEPWNARLEGWIED
jgi:hypothetical protein